MGTVVDVMVIVPDAVRIVVCWPANNGFLCKTIGVDDVDVLRRLFVGIFCSITLGTINFWALEFCCDTSALANLHLAKSSFCCCN